MKTFSSGSAKRSLLVIEIISLLIILGSLPSPASGARTEESKDSAGLAKETAEIKPEKVTLIDARKFKGTMKELKGKVVLVNMWATWCIPCRQEFPMLIQLYREYKSQGLELLAISNDDIQNFDDVTDFVEERQVPFPTFIVAPNGTNELREVIYPEWTGAIPSTFFFDRRGILKERISGTRDRAHFEASIKALL
jgi:thiol-disulfide isomerase/thioredoxin